MIQQYEMMGISPEVYRFGNAVWNSLSDRFASFDETAEYNQLKVSAAMRSCRVSAEHRRRAHCRMQRTACRACPSTVQVNNVSSQSFSRLICSSPSRPSISPTIVAFSVSMLETL